MADFRVYVDPDTGDEYTEDEIDSIDPSLRSSAEPEDSWLNRTAWRTYGSIGETAGNTFGGGLEFLADMFPDNTVTDYLEEKGRTARQTGQRINQIQETWGDLDRSTWGGTAADVASKGVSTVIPMLPALAAGPATFGAQAGLGTAGREYGRMLEEDKDPDKARAAALARGAFDAGSSYLLPQIGGMTGATGIKQYLSSIPKTLATLTGINALTGANTEATEQWIMEERALEDVDFEKIGKAGTDAVSQNFEDSLGLAAILGPAGVKFAAKPRSKEGVTGPKVGETADVRPSIEIDNTQSRAYGPDKDFFYSPAVQEPTLPQSLAEAYNRRAATLGEDAAAFTPRADLADAAPQALKDGAPFVPDTLPAVQEPTLDMQLAAAYARKVAQFGEQGAAALNDGIMTPEQVGMTRTPAIRDIDYLIDQYVPTGGPDSMKGVGEWLQQYAANEGPRPPETWQPPKPVISLADAYRPKTPPEPPIYPLERKPPQLQKLTTPFPNVLGTNNSVPLRRPYSVRVPAADSGSSFPVPVSERVPSSRKIAPLSKDEASAGTLSETRSQEPASIMSVGEIIAEPSANTPAIAPDPKFQNTNASAPDSESRYVPSRSIDTSPGEIDGKPVNFNVEAVPRSSVVARPDLMQHREGSDPVTGVHKDRAINAKTYDRIKAGPLLVWEPVNPAEHGLDVAKGERYIVGNGHNRLGHAVKTDAPVVDIQVLREADGFSAADVRRTAAEQNIANDNASFLDTVKFFRESARKLGPEAARARAKELGVRSQNAETVAYDGSSALLREVISQRLDERAALAIARAAPGDEARQGEALKKIAEGESAETAANFLRLSNDPELIKALAKTTPEGTQTRIGGESVEQGEIITRLARLVGEATKQSKDRLAGNRQALKNRKKGIDLEEGIAVEKSDNELASRVDQLKQNLDTVALIRDNAALRNLAIKSLKQGLPDKTVIERISDYISKMKGNESGAIVNPAQVAADAYKTAQDKIMSALRRPKLDPRVKEQQIDPSEAWLNGVVNGHRVPGLATFRRLYSRAEVIASKHPVAKQIWRNNGDRIEYENTLLSNFHKKLSPYYDLVDNKKVGQALASAREEAMAAAKLGQTLVVNDQTLAKAGLNPVEIEAYKAARETLDDAFKVAEDALIDHWTEKLQNDPNPTKLAKKISEVQSFFFEKKQQHYFPIHRFGDYFVWGENPVEGEAPWYNLFPSKRAAVEAANNLAAQGYKDIRKGNIRKIQDAAFHDTPADLALDLQKLSGEKEVGEFPLEGFKGHLLRAKMVEGYEADLKRNISEYTRSLSKWAANLKYDKVQRDLLSQIDNRNPMYQEMSDFLDYNRKGGQDFQAVRTIMAVDALGFAPSSAALNFTQAATVVYPELRRLTNQPAKHLQIAIRKQRLLRKDRAAFEQRYPELARDMRRAADAGKLDSALFETSVKRDPTPFQKFSEISLGLFSFADRWTRSLAFIAAHDTAPPGADKYAAARDFTDRSNFDYGKNNQPRIARGKMAPFYIFKQYGHNYWGNVTEALGEFGRESIAGLSQKARGDYEQAKKSFDKARTAAGVSGRYVGAAWLLGGYKALPFAREFLAIAAAWGLDLDDTVRKLFDDEQDLVSLAMYGPSIILGGVQLTGALSPELLPVDKGFLGGAAQLAIGYPLSYVKRAERAKQSYDTFGDMGRAATELAPRGLRNAITAYNWWDEGAAKNTRGQTVMDNPTLSEIYLKALSFNPSRNALAQEKSRSIQLLDERSTAETSGFTNKMAVAIEMGDRERLRELIQEAQRVGSGVTPAQVMERLKQNKNPDYRQFKAVPKRKREEAAEMIKRGR